MGGVGVIRSEQHSPKFRSRLHLALKESNLEPHREEAERRSEDLDRKLAERQQEMPPGQWPGRKLL